MEDILKVVREAREKLIKFADDLPDLDANCTVYSIAMYSVQELDRFLKDIPPAMIEATRLTQKNPNRKGKIW